MEANITTKIESFLKRMDGDKLPMMTLEEFFGNEYLEEDFIAPNQWGFGRPSLAEIHEQLRKVEVRPDVAWVRVVLHGDTDVGDRDGEAVYEIMGDAIAICTIAEASEIEQAANCEFLCSDGVDGIFDDTWHTEIPGIPEGYKVRVLWWD